MAIHSLILMNIFYILVAILILAHLQSEIIGHGKSRPLFREIKIGVTSEIISCKRCKGHYYPTERQISPGMCVDILDKYQTR
jgi:hypothetical protein